MDKHYCWIAMREGKLMDGMYTRSEKTETPALAQKLARPDLPEADAFALCMEEVDGDRLVRRVIVSIETKSATPDGEFNVAADILSYLSRYNGVITIRDGVATDKNGMHVDLNQWRSDRSSNVGQGGQS